MADDANEQELTEENLLQRHRKEKRELQNKIQALKKSATKGDKKKKKEISEEIARIEKELNDKQSEELRQFQQVNVKCVAENAASDNDTEEIKQANHKVSKAQKRREKKAMHEKEREKLIKEEEKTNINCAKSVETRTINKILKDRDLMVHEIPSDGNCMYCAVDFQLKLLGKELGLEKLRLLTSEYMRQHIHMFLPFVSNQDNSEKIMSEEEYEEYCDKVANTSAWGGEVELRALSHALSVPIEVIQASGPPIIIGEEYSKPGVLLTYHRHMYGLGEHYNSVKPYEQVSEDEYDAQCESPEHVT